MAANSKSDAWKSMLIRDTSEDKAKFKKQITDSIKQHVKNANRVDIEKAVEKRYEELLDSASVRRHIPALTEGEIKAVFRGIEKKNNRI